MVISNPFIKVKPFIIYNLKTNDSYVVLDINIQKRYTFYYDFIKKERIFGFQCDDDGSIIQRMIY